MLENLPATMAMADAEYEAKKRDAKIYCKQVLAAFNAFSPDVLDRDELHANLWKVKDKFLQVTGWMDEVVVDLEANNEEERILELTAMLEHVQTRMNDNQKAVKEKMEKVITDTSHTHAS